VSVALDEDDGVIIEDHTSSEMNLVEPFSLVANDGVAPVVINFRDPNRIPVDEIDYDRDEDVQTVLALFDFSETMDPDIYKVAKSAKYYFMTDSNVTVLSFAQDQCGGKRIAVNLKISGKVSEAVRSITLIGPDPDEDEPQFKDLGANSAAEVTFRLYQSTVPAGLWNLPEDPADPGNPIEIKATPSPQSMRIYGEIRDPNGDVYELAQAGDYTIFAFHRDELFEVVDKTEGVYEVEFDINPANAFGAANVQKDGKYYIIAYGLEEISETPGFADGDAVILVLCTDPGSTDNADYQIATTACLANEDFSIEFDGNPTKEPIEKNLDLSKREVITVQRGWTLFSTSISSSYIDETRTTLGGLNPANFEGYLYGPDDPLAAESGSLPAADEVYSLDDISSVLFTISHKHLTKNVFYDPATNPLNPVTDELADRFNKTPVFCTARGYYVYVDANIPGNDADQEWQIVLFGDKVSSPEYKLRVASNSDLIGQWGSLAYYTDEGLSTLNNLRGLPSTFSGDADDKIRVDDIASNSKTDPDDDIALSIVDVNGDPVNASVLSTFLNYRTVTGKLNQPAAWYASLPDFNDMVFVAPAQGLWLLVDADNADGPFFVSYLPRPEED
jgi:hypothetical protein